MQTFRFPTSQESWLGINRAMIDVASDNPDALVYSNQVIMFDVFIKIDRSWIAPDWDFTKTANYTMSKWTSLVNNYVNRSHLEEILSTVHLRELKKDRNYSISFHFSNEHGGGKGCLLTATFARRYGETDPVIHATMRASEFYKRGMFDLLLLHRLGQMAWGEDASFGLTIFAHQMWGGSMWLAMLSSEIKPKELFKDISPGSFKEKVYDQYNKLMDIDNIEGLNFHSAKRAVKVIQGKVNNKRLLMQDCLLNY